MATRTGYIGNPTSTWLWDQQEQITTVISSSLSNGYSGMGSTWPQNSSQILKMDTDEYPTAISFSGYARNRGWTEALTIGLSDHSGNNYHQLNSVTMSGPDEYGDLYLDMSQYNGSGTWTNLTGATLALKKTSTYRLYRLESTTISVTTAYLNKTITLHTIGAGTATIDYNSRMRGETAILTLTPVGGYKVGNVVATAGTLTKMSSNTYTFVMPTPAQNITITVNFNPIAFTATQGQIIYAEWYNQE